MRPVLLLEINEVPWRIIDKYASDSRYPNIRKFFSKASTHTTITAEKVGMLDPWVTWPTLHRGMGHEEHGVLNLGQDPATFKGTPIWEEYRLQGYSIGVCGSLQSWPPQNPGKGGFYVPDTFAHDESCIPAYVAPFQKFNLGQVARNGRVVKGSAIFSSSIFGLIGSLPRLGISLKTILKLFRHLVAETRDKNLRARRTIFQSILLWDIFKGLYNPKSPPAFSTFFTNHVASTMHRYWKHIFPEDFGARYRDEPKIHAATMDFSMDLLDEILKDSMGFCDKNPELILVFASSMGQKAIVHEWHEGFEASVPRLERLMTACGMKAGDYHPLLAMVPQVAVEVDQPDLRQGLLERIRSCRTESGTALFAVQEVGVSLSISILTPKIVDIRAGGFTMRQEGETIRRFTWEDAGISMNAVDPGTAYHFPEGTLALYGRGIEANDARTSMGAAEVKSFLMAVGGLPTSRSSALQEQPAVA